MKLTSKKKTLTKKQIIIIAVAISCLLIIVAGLLLAFRHVHSFGEWEKIRDASCSQFGLERRFCECGKMQEKKYDKLQHTESKWIFDSEKNIQKIVCTVCNKTLQVNSLENHTHAWSEYAISKEATCTEKGESLRSCECGATDILVHSANGHDFCEWITITDPKCEISGLKQRICNVCNTHEEESISPLSHKEGAWSVLENEKCYPCIHCGSILRTEAIIISQHLDIINGVVTGLGSCEDTVLCIPSTYENKPVQVIGEYAFEYLNIKGIILPDSVTEIEKHAFYQCTDIESVHLGNGIISIGKKAFYNCQSLKTVTLPESLTSISDYAFAGCTSLESVYMGSQITVLSARVFEDCINLKSIYFAGTIEDWNNLSKDTEWDLGTSSYTVYCLDGNIVK